MEIDYRLMDRRFEVLESEIAKLEASLKPRMKREAREDIVRRIYRLHREQVGIARRVGQLAEIERRSRIHEETQPVLQAG